MVGIELSKQQGGKYRNETGEFKGTLVDSVKYSLSRDETSNTTPKKHISRQQSDLDTIIKPGFENRHKLRHAEYEWRHKGISLLITLKLDQSHLQ